MMKDGLITQMKMQEKFFLNTIDCLTEDDSNFKPQEEMYTIAQHIGHTAETIDWFFEGAFGENGFDMNFVNYAETMKKYTSFDESVKYFKEATANGIKTIELHTHEELLAPIKAEIMNGDPKMVIVNAIVDHTAHHRGSLAVYARLLGKKPQMPYGGM